MYPNNPKENIMSGSTKPNGKPTKISRGFKWKPETLELLKRASDRHHIDQIDILEYAVNNECRRLMKLKPTLAPSG